MPLYEKTKESGAGGFGTVRAYSPGMDTMREYRYLTKPRPYDDGFLVAEVSYKLLRGNSEPYFAITAMAYGKQRIPGETSIQIDGRRFYCYAGGCMHDAIATVFPELAPFLPWHLAGPSGPMHYAANAIYFCQQIDGCAEHMRPEDTRERAIAGFRSTVAFGVLPGESMPDLPDPSPNMPAARYTYARQAYDATRRKIIAGIVGAWCVAREEKIKVAFVAAVTDAKRMEGAI